MSPLQLKGYVDVAHSCRLYGAYSVLCLFVRICNAINIFFGLQNPSERGKNMEEDPTAALEMILDEIHKHPFTTREQLAKVIGITFAVKLLETKI